MDAALMRWSDALRWRQARDSDRRVTAFPTTTDLANKIHLSRCSASYCFVYVEHIGAKRFKGTGRKYAKSNNLMAHAGLSLARATGSTFSRGHS
jgi:hypothetical protein